MPKKTKTRKEHHVVPNTKGGWDIKKAGGTINAKTHLHTSPYRRFKKPINTKTPLILC